MKTLFNIFSLAFLILIGQVSFAQKVSIDSLLLIKQEHIDLIDTNSLRQNQVILHMDFNQSKLLNPSALEKLKGKSIEKIELYYTSYKLAQEFSQPKLNGNRLKELQYVSPELFQNTKQVWKFYAQTKGKNEEEAKQLFHGFIITFKPKPIFHSPKTEVEYITRLIHNDSLGKDSFIMVNKPIIKKRRIATGYYLPNLSSKRKDGVLYDSKGIWDRKKQFKTVFDTTMKYEKVEKFTVADDVWKYLSKMHDSTVLSILKRHSEWTNILFVCDVTGSMSPYSGQLLLWNKLNYNSGKGKYFTFFNDGDGIEDDLKRLGQTGGIYHVEANSLKEIENVATKAMIKGDGGDEPENYIEAILSAMNRFPKASEIVLIADNWARIKDIELLYQVKKPVHIILCGTEYGINPDYIKLAQKTKGSVHTMEQDLNDLDKLRQGDKIKIGNQNFEYRDGRLKLIRAL